MTVDSASSKICFVCKGQFGGDVTHCPQDGTLLSSGDPLVGTVFDGKYELLSLAGQGGFGLVYKARQPALERTVAVKILKSIATSDPDNVHRFMREARAASELAHPNIATVYAFGVAPSGEAYLVMEYVQGRKLSDILGATGAMPMPRALNIIRQVCAALSFAHSKSIIHRDIKPGNIIVLAGDQVKVVDFGSAKFLSHQDERAQQVTRPGEQIGTMEYMSPEQLNAGQVDARTDVYAIGKVLCELVCVDGKIPSEIVPIADRALQEDPQKRYADAGQLLQDIDSVAAHHQVGGTTMKLVQSPGTQRSTAGGAGKLVTFACLSAIGALVIYTFCYDEASASAAQAMIAGAESLGAFHNKTGDDFLVSLLPLVGDGKRQTQEVLAEAVVRHTGERDGKRLAWLDAVTRLLKMRKADGRDVRSDPYALEAFKALKVLDAGLLERRNVSEMRAFGQAEKRWATVVCGVNDEPLHQAHMLMIDVAKAEGNLQQREQLLRQYRDLISRSPSSISQNQMARITMELCDTEIKLGKPEEAAKLFAQCVSLVMNNKLPDGAHAMPLHGLAIQVQSSLKGQKRIDFLQSWLTTIPALFSLPCSRKQPLDQARVETLGMMSQAHAAMGDMKAAQADLEKTIGVYSNCVPWQSRGFIELALFALIENPKNRDPQSLARSAQLVNLAKSSPLGDVAFAGLLGDVDLSLVRNDVSGAYKLAEAAVPKLKNLTGTHRGESYFLYNALCMMDMNAQNWESCARYARKSASHAPTEHAKQLSLKRAAAAMRHERFVGN